MAQQGVNPYSRPSAVAGESPDPSGRFRIGGPGKYSVVDVPDSTDPDWTVGYSPELANGGSPDGTALPSDIRVGTREPPPNDPNDRLYNQIVYSDENKRYNDQSMRYTGWKVQQHKVPPGQNPMWTQERMPVRPTADTAPMGTEFKRYWHVPRSVTDAVGPDAITHFSMADHRRVYEIMGQKPQGRLGTNTYRASPRPWDEDLYTVPEVSNAYGSVFGNRAYRMGG